ncbi:hypothetical protein ACE6H2_010556 [Prunus campanulata]
MTCSVKRLLFSSHKTNDLYTDLSLYFLLGKRVNIYLYFKLCFSQFILSLSKRIPNLLVSLVSF